MVATIFVLFSGNFIATARRLSLSGMCGWSSRAGTGHGRDRLAGRLRVGGKRSGSRGWCRRRHGIWREGFDGERRRAAGEGRMGHEKGSHARGGSRGRKFPRACAEDHGAGTPVIHLRPLGSPRRLTPAPPRRRPKIRRPRSNIRVDSQSSRRRYSPGGSVGFVISHRSHGRPNLPSWRVEGARDSEGKRSTRKQSRHLRGVRNQAGVSIEWLLWGGGEWRVEILIAVDFVEAICRGGKCGADAQLRRLCGKQIFPMRR